MPLWPSSWLEREGLPPCGDNAAPAAACSGRAALREALRLRGAAPVGTRGARQVGHAGVPKRGLLQSALSCQNQSPVVNVIAGHSDTSGCMIRIWQSVAGETSQRKQQQRAGVRQYQPDLLDLWLRRMLVKFGCTVCRCSGNT